MKLKSLSVLLVLVAGLLAVPAASAQPADWIEYVDAQRGFSLRYPPQWSVVDVGALAAFAVGEPERPGQVRKNVVVANPVTVPEGTTIDQQQDKEDEFARGVFTGYTVIKRDPLEVGTVPGSVVHYTVPFGPLRFYQMRLVLIAGTHAHAIVGTAAGDSQTLDADLALLLSIMTTYRIAPSP